MQITFTLQPQYTGAEYVAGPFNISGTTSGNVTYELATGVTKNQLVSGYEVTTEYSTITGGTIQSTGTCTNSEPWVIPGAGPSAGCWSLTYTSVPGDLSVRYRNAEGTVVTTLIQNVDTMDNGNGTFTAYICVSLTGSYNTPTCFQGGVEIDCGQYVWTNQQVSCTIASTCVLN